jgi:hypothetical protein
LGISGVQQPAYAEHELTKIFVGIAEFDDMKHGRCARLTLHPLRSGLSQQPLRGISCLDQEFGASAVAVAVGFDRIQVEAPYDVKSLALQQVPG